MTQPGDVTVIATLSIQNGANAPIVRAGEACDGWINTLNHTTRDALPTAITTLGTLVRTLNDGIVWEVTSVGPVVYSLWSGSGGGLGGLITVADNTARDAYPAALRKEGMLVYSAKTQCYYELQQDLTTWAFFDANPALASQATWYVDPAGSNNNDGKTSGTAIADLIELSNRLSPRGKVCALTNNVTVNVNSVSLTAVSYGELALNVGVAERLIGDVAIYTLSVVCAVTSTAPITLSSYTTPSGVSAIRGQMATASGTFVNQERIRMTSGTALGAVCYSTGLNGDAQHTFVSILSIPTPTGIVANSGHGATLIPVPGDTCVVDTLTVSINRVAINCATPFAQVVVYDAKIVQAVASGVTRSLFAGSGGSVLFSGCWQSSVGGAWFCTSGGAFLLSCRTPSGDATSLIGEGWCIIEHAVQGLLALDGEALSYGLTLDGGRLVVGMNSDPHHPSLARTSRWLAFTSFTNLATGGAIEAENGASGSFTSFAAITVAEGSTFVSGDFNTYMWGASSPFGQGFYVAAHAFIVQQTVADGTIAACFKIPSTVNLVIANLYFAYSDNTIYLENNNCGLISAASPVIGNNLNQEDNTFYLTAQSGNQGPVTFPAMTKAGFYEVWGYVATTVVDAAALGNPILNVIFTDDSGVQRTVPVAASPSLTTLGGNGGIVPIESVAAGTIRWSVTGIGSAGASKYSIRMGITKRSSGA